MAGVSVVIPVLDGAATIRDTLTALLRQADAPEQTEIIVVDNGSRDATCDIVRAFTGVRLVHEPRRGPAAARNCGIRHARGEIIAHCDADTLPTRRWLHALIAPFADPAVMLCVGRTLCFTPRTAVERYIAAAGLYESERAITRPPFPFAPSLNMAVRRSAALAAGGWNEELLTAEDVDFSQRVLARHPAPIAFAQDAVLFHRTRSTAPELRALARSYGAGVAQMYLRYPEKAHWGATASVKTVARLAVRVAQAALLTAGHRVQLVPSARAEFARCHALWSWNFSRGFAQTYRARKGAA